MPPKNCARCQKIVYPTEELKCLDQTWHKLCFKCEECGMSLNVKTFKAFEKRPYCPAHCPKLQATFVADTPESRRLAENSKIQSQVQYHHDFERSKGQYYHLGLEDPEIQRAIKVANNISNVKYHEDFERQKGTRTTVVDDPEMMRIRQNTAIQSGVAYKGIQRQRDEMETRRPTEREIDDVAELSQQLAHSRIMGPPQPIQIYHSNATNGYPMNGQGGYYHHQNGADANGYTNGYHGTYSPPDSISPPSDRGYHLKGHATTIFSHDDDTWVPDHLRNSYSPSEFPSGGDFSNPYPRQDFRTVIKSFDNGGLGVNTDFYYQESRYDGPPSAHVSSQQRMPTKVGSIADYDPVNNQWGSIASGPQQYQQAPPQHAQQPSSYQQRGPAAYQQPSPQMVSPGSQQHKPPQQTQDELSVDVASLKTAVEELDSELEQPVPDVADSPAPFKDDYNNMAPEEYRNVHEASREENNDDENNDGNDDDGVPPGMPLPPPPVEMETVPDPEPESAEEPEEDWIKEGARYRAMYDYDAQEEDEASFYMDDVITNVKRIDEGWVVGTVMRTGRTGMVPANYIDLMS